MPIVYCFFRLLISSPWFLADNLSADHCVLLRVLLLLLFYCSAYYSMFCRKHLQLFYATPPVGAAANRYFYLTAVNLPRLLLLLAAICGLL